MSGSCKVLMVLPSSGLSPQLLEVEAVASCFAAPGILFGLSAQ